MLNGNGNGVHAPYASRSSLASPRPPSSYAASSSPRTTSDRIFDDHRTSPGHQSHFSGSSTSSSGNVLDSSNRQIRRDSPSKKSLRSSRSSIELYPPQPRFTRHSKSQFSLRDLPPLPPSRPSTATSQKSQRLPNPHSLSHPSSLSRLANAATPSPPPTPAQQLIAQKQTASPSNTSLVPSEGEDMDAFHVRSTYAQLEASGVRGDGYEEGVERTRARVGASRESQFNADSAISDGTEKQGDLDPRELQVLAGVDRYGFFNLPSHDRLVRLDAAPLLKKLSRTQRAKDGAGSRVTFLRSLPPSPPPLRELSRTAKWTQMLKAEIRDGGRNTQFWRIRSSKESKLRERTYKGIPDCWRRAAWDMLMCRFAASGPEKSAALANDYREALDKPSSYDVQIDLDVPRTISGHVMFKTRYGAGQCSLFHVLHAFSLRCPTCGYVQGMGPIAATLLNYFDPERVYASLVRLHDAYSLHSVFSPGFPGMLEAIYLQERITEMFMPDVYAAFKQHMISTTSYATKWYITLFANSVPFQMQLRIWDVFLLEGYDVFVAIAVAIVWVYRDHITAKSANFETVLSLLSSFFVPEDENALMSWINKTLSDKKLRSNMRRWREDWKALVKAGKEGSALL
ncbi:hypothetical protein M378DRAFT_65012 [Amanita muscaria Koide BX008]|uniref:Rab-GAP TBC domain-containing protein n=1 Tax=Amanita muscaria (strain Koide BX008) TaxID=946122 RepID=A0A0C2T610_AMAMK|nr:hypothetical protein M378DRAFT_65012 [Amanita muscaria Koide BX008]